ncbi:MAG: hypothetical protein IJO83_02540 [Clostridia bacterium]|nr:hypothetical protein [Clostridia bacterium]
MIVYKFELKCDKETAIKEVLQDTEKPKLIFENESMYGKRVGSFINLYCGISYRNSFRSIFTMYFKEVEPGRTVAKGIFRWQWFGTLFSVVWLSLVASIWFNIGDADIFAFVVPLFFVLFFVGLVSFCTYLERNNRKDVINHIKMHQRIINGE